MEPTKEKTSSTETYSVGRRYPICMECRYFTQTTIQTNTRELVPVLLCSHEACRNPVSGVPMLCTEARQMPHFCTMPGLYFEKKEETKPTPIVEVKT